MAASPFEPSPPDIAAALVRPDETLEPFGQGRLWVLQKQRGYRFSIDAVILAGLTTLRPGERVIDLGTGCGIIPLILACRYPEAVLVGVESQPALADLAARNVRLNGFSPRITIEARPMQEVQRCLPPASCQVVVSNPPYRPLGAGRLNPQDEKACARHELQGSLATVAAAARYLLPEKGRLSVIYPAWRTVHLLTLLRSHDLEPKILRFIHSRSHTPARLVWVEARRAGGEELLIPPPLVVYQDQRQYTAEMAELLNLAPVKPS
jgi:tRNA1Val (adenine37-N6)-methyltransferase